MKPSSKLRILEIVLTTVHERRSGYLTYVVKFPRDALLTICQQTDHSSCYEEKEKHPLMKPSSNLRILAVVLSTVHVAIYFTL